MIGYRPAASYYAPGLGGFGLVAPPVPDVLNLPRQWRTHPHLTGFILGAVAMYALPPFLGGILSGADAELRERASRRNRSYGKAEDARLRRLANRSRR